MGRIMGKTFGIVHILIADEAAEHRLAQQASQYVPSVLAAPALRQRRARQIGEAERVVQFPLGQQAGVGGDPAAVEFQLQSPVEINPQRPIIRFTRWVLHRHAASLKTTL